MRAHLRAHVERESISSSVCWRSAGRTVRTTTSHSLHTISAQSAAVMMPFKQPQQSASPKSACGMVVPNDATLYAGAIAPRTVTRACKRWNFTITVGASGVVAVAKWNAAIPAEKAAAESQNHPPSLRSSLNCRISGPASPVSRTPPQIPTDIHS
jgi:hypothetical protein